MRVRTKRFLIIGIVLVLGVAAIITIFARLNKLETKQTVGTTLFEYNVGKLDDTTGRAMTTAQKEDFENNGGLYNGYMSLKKFVNPDGLKIKLAEKAKVKYKVYIFDEDYNLISVSPDWLTEDYTFAGNVSGAAYAKIEVMPIGDADGVISTTEISTYAKMLTIKYNKFEEEE